MHDAWRFGLAPARISAPRHDIGTAQGLCLAGPRLGMSELASADFADSDLLQAPQAHLTVIVRVERRLCKSVRRLSRKLA